MYLILFIPFQQQHFEHEGMGCQITQEQKDNLCLVGDEVTVDTTTFICKEGTEVSDAKYAMFVKEKTTLGACLRQDLIDYIEGKPNLV